MDTNVQRRVEALLGYGIGAGTGEREYPVLDGVVYTDLFSGTPTVSVSGFTLAFNGRKYGTAYYNEIIVGDVKADTVTVNATWGSDEFNDDIDGLIEWATNHKPEFDAAGITSKKIEDFSVSLADAEKRQDDFSVILNEGYGYYVRKPSVLEINGEQRREWLNF